MSRSAIVQVEIKGVDRFDTAVESLNLALREAVNALADIRIMAGSDPAGAPMMSRAEAEAAVLRALRGDE